MMRNFVIYLVLGAISLTVSWTALAQKPQPVSLPDRIEVVEHPRKSRGSGDDQNITSRAIANDTDLKSGGEENLRDLLCGIQVENKTSWRVQVFVDGTLEGVVGPRGKLYSITVCGRAKFYAIADFKDGGSVTWGPREFNTKDGDFSWSVQYD